MYEIMSGASPTTPPLLHGRYRILARLGEGRLAIVYRATDERLKRNVLVHLLRAEFVQQPNLRQRFEEEAQRGAQRSHPGLLEVYDSGDVSGRPYMVTENIDGQPLAEAGPLNVGEALSSVRTIVSAVALAQEQGGPRPPISSRNVWLLAGGRTVLLENWNTTPGDLKYELAPYRAPELARGAPPSPATSVYALGVLAWEAFVGRRPFTNLSPEAVLQEQLQRELPPISQARPALFSPELDRIVAQAAAADPNLRYATPTDFGRALDHYVDATSAQTGRLVGLPIAAPVPAPPQQRSLRMPLSRGQAQPASNTTTLPTSVPPAPKGSRARAAATIAPPPPPPVLQEPPPQARPISARAPAPAYDQRDIDKQIKHEVRREVRRQGCRRALIKRSLQLVMVFLLLYGAWLGIQYAVDYARGQVQQINIGQWLSRQLPDVNDFIPDWLQDPGSVIAEYRLTQPTNLRAGPGTTAEIVQQLEAGTTVRAAGVPENDPNNDPYLWTRVILNDGTTGYIADLTDRSERQ